MTGIIYISLAENIATKHETVVMITIATYTFYKITMAIIHAVKYQKNRKKIVGIWGKIEDTVVGGYPKIEDAFVDRYLAKDGKTVEKANKDYSRECCRPFLSFL